MIEPLERRRLLAAAVPTLVKDINTQAESSSAPLNLFSNGTTSYFTELDVNFGYELWKTDGTTDGTVMVKDINPGAASSLPGNFAQLGSTIYFSATTADAGTELWKTDGTAAGTVMVRDINLGSPSSKPTYLRVAGSTLFFFAETPGATNQLWKSDGTLSGTSMVVPINSDSATQSIWLPSHTAVLGNSYLWLGQNSTTFGLFRSDGTTAGTSLVKGAASDFTPDAIVAGPGRAILVSNQTEAAGVPLYSTDGTTAGTTQIASIASKTSFAVVGTNLYYATYDNTNGYRLFRRPLTGTAATQITTPAGMQQPVNLMAFGQSLLFTAFVNSTSQTGLYQVTATGTTATFVTNYSVAANQLQNPVLLGSTLYFINSATQELWKTDGTASGTMSIATLAGLDFNDVSYPAKMVAVGSRVVVINRTAATGTELWTSSGTAASFALLKDINTGTTHSDATATGRIGNVSFYSANDGIHGAELWRTDGTAAGTSLVKDINPGSANSGPSHGVTLGNRLLFSATNPANSSDLWITDGTTAGTTLIDVPGGEKMLYDTIPVVMNGVAYFNAQTSAAGAELWRSDGTVAGTYMVKDISAATDNSYPMAFTVLNGRLYFTAATPVAGRELWASDGTAAGTVLVKDVYPGASDGVGLNGALSIANGKLFFAGTDSATGTELWTSDGTPAGTVRVADLNPGTASSSPGITYGGNGAMVQISDMLYFSAKTPATGNELFRLNLKTMQVSLAADLVPATGDSTPTGLKAFDGVLTFTTSSTSAFQFYTFDESGGAVKRLAFATGGGGSAPATIANGALFFQGYGPSGNTLYEWDGGSADVQAITGNPALLSVSYTNLMPLADALVFAANTYPYGIELMKVADTAAPRAYQTALDLNGTPRVRVDWSESVIASANTAQLISRATNQPVSGVTVIRTIRADGSGVDYSFSSKLPDGDYRLTFNSADFHDAAGIVGSGTKSFDFFVLAGDLNHDRVVNFDDLIILAQNYGTTGKTFAQGNLDGSADGSVNFDDLIILAQQYNKTLALPAIAAVTSSSPISTTKKSRVAASVLN